MTVSATPIHWYDHAYTGLYLSKLYLRGTDDKGDRSSGGAGFNIGHAGGHLPDDPTGQRTSLEIEGFEGVAPALRDETWITQRADLEWDHLVHEVPTESQTVEPSEGSETLISEPRGGSSDEEIGPQDESQHSNHGQPHFVHEESRPSSFGGGSPDSRDPAHRPLAQNPDQQDQPPYQTQEASPDPDPILTPVTTAGKAKAFLETNLCFSLAAITAISLCIALSVGFKTHNLGTGAVTGTCIWTSLLITYGFLLLVWRGQERMHENQRRETMEVAATAAGRVVEGATV
ncbi:MAG: hypothetical protein M1840_005241 [Geoglossum simile]|nr:MAG: hypothetical protein M1840_005241 [Geoglossum simile]